MILLIGANGLLGTYLSRSLKKDDCITTSNDPTFGADEILDLANLDQIYYVLDKYRPDTVIIAAALTNVNLCETNPELSYRINVEATKKIVDTTNVMGSALAEIIFISTDYIYGGNKIKTYDDIADPQNVYGKHKLLAEHYIMSNAHKYKIFRTCNLYGISKKRANFALYVLDSFLAGKTIKVRKGQIDTPTYAGDFANHIMMTRFWQDSADKNIVNNYSNGLSLPRKDFAKIIIENIGYHLTDNRQYNIEEFEDSITISRPNGGFAHYRDIFTECLESFKREVLSEHISKTLKA